MNNMNFMQMLQQLRQNPMQMLSQRFNVPQNIQNPQDIIQHLLNTGQISQNQVNQAMQMRQQMYGGPKNKNCY